MSRAPERQGGRADRVIWLILSYRAGIDGSACSQHIDDRLAEFQAQGVEPVLLSGPVGERVPGIRHHWVPSLAPSGIRFEVRHFLRKRCASRFWFKVFETLLLLPVLPFYLLEKLVINLESEWSWCFLAALRGAWLCRGLHPAVLYTTGGSASAHMAGCCISRVCQVTWIAETQDPLVHDQGWRRGRRALAVYRALERCIARRAHCFVFLCQGARDNMAARTGMGERAVVVHPGSRPEFFAPIPWPASPPRRLVFAHFGALGGTRNLVVFFQALDMVLRQEPDLRDLVRVEAYGSLDSLSRRAMEEAGLTDLVAFRGQLPRDQALAAMRGRGCLLLVQNVIFFSCETIPSKLYEYLLAGPPVLGLVYRNPELSRMLRQAGHRAVPADDPEAVAGAIRDLCREFRRNRANGVEPSGPRKEPRPLYTVAAAVRRLRDLAREAGA